MSIAQTRRTLYTTPDFSKRHHVVFRAVESLESRMLLALTPVTGVGTGLVGGYFADGHLANLAETRLDSQVSFNWSNGSPFANQPADGFGASWVGKVQAQFTETYTFYTQTSADDGVRLTIYTSDLTVAGARKANVLIDTWTGHTSAEKSGAVALKAGETYDIRLEYTNTTGNASVSLKWSSPSTPKALIPGTQLYPSQVLSASSVGGNWLDEGIGSPAVAGALTSVGRLLTLSAGGSGIAGTTDQFHYGYQTLQGDGIATIRISRLRGTGLNNSSRAGLMIRDGSAANARYAGIFLTGNGNVAFQSRTSAGESTTTTTQTNVGNATWLRLVRRGPTLLGYISSTGKETSWQYVGRADIKGLPGKLLMGLAASSHNVSSPISVTASNVKLAADVPIGANLGGVATYAGTMPFIDYIKGGAGSFRKLNADGSVSGTDAALDATDQWPTEDFGISGPYLQKPDGFTNQTHILTFNGKATVTGDWSGVTVTPASSSTGDAGYASGYNSTTNASKYYLKNTDYSGNNNTAMRLRFRGTQRTSASATGTGLTNVKLLQAGYTTYSEDQVFTQEWIQSVRRLKAIRFMDWAHTNGNLDANWTDRTFIGQHTNQTAAWEYMVQLCNTVKRDMWINIPAHASVDYVQKLAKLIRFGSNGVNPFNSDAEYQAYAGTKYRGLDPDLNVYVEYSNEVWNYSFESWSYASGQANAAYDAGTKYGPNQVTLNFDGSAPGASTQQRTNRWVAAHLLGDFVPAFQTAFGADSITARVRPVLCGWQIYPDTTIEQGAMMLDAAGWKPSDSIYGVSITGYFGYSDLAQAQVAPNSSRDTATTEELLDIFLTGASENTSDYRWRTTSALAAKYGVKMVAYESGPSIGGTAAQAAAQMDPRFRQVTVNGMNNWYAAGADLSNFFSLHYTNGYGSQYGDWCFSDNRWDENQPRAAGFWDVRGAAQSPAIVEGFTALPSGELETRFYVANSAPNVTYTLQNTSSGSKTYRYLIRAVSGMDVSLRISAAATASNQSLSVRVNNGTATQITFASAASNDPAGNARYSDTSPVTIHLEPGPNSLDLICPGTSGGGSPRINAMRFTPVGGSLVNTQLWGYGLPGNPQSVTENVKWTSSNIDFQDNETPAVANQASPFTVTATSDNQSLIPNGSISWTYTASTTKWALAVTPAASKTGKANITIAVTDPGGASRSWTFPFQVIPATPTSVNAVVNADGSVNLTWTNASQAMPRFQIQRSIDKNTSGLWQTIETTAAKPAGAASFTDRPPGGASYFYRVIAVDSAGLSSSAGNANSSNAVAIPATAAGGSGFNATSLFDGKTYFAGTFSSGNVKYPFDGTSSYAQYSSGTAPKMAITALSGTTGIGTMNFLFPKITNSYNAITTVVPPGVSIYYSTTDYSGSSTNALDSTKYTRLGTSSFTISNAKVTVSPDNVYQTTLAGLAIPSGVKSVLLVFDNTTSGPHLSEVQAFPTSGTTTVTGLAGTSTFGGLDPSSFANYVGAKVTLTWTNPAARGTNANFVVQRDTTNTFGSSNLRTWSGPANATTFVNDRDKQDAPLKPYAATWDSTRNTPLPAGTTYYYRVGTRQNDGSIVYTSALTVTTAAASYPLAKPTNITATAANSAQINLSWTAVAGAAGYKIERAMDSGFTNKVTMMSLVTDTTYNDKTCNSNGKYYYRVRATTGGSGDSDYATASATTAAITAAPAGLVAVGDEQNVHLSWIAPFGKIYAYEVLRGTSPSNLQVIQSFVAGQEGMIVPCALDGGLPNNTTYYYAVRGVLWNNASPGGLQYTANSNVVSATTVAPAPPAIINGGSDGDTYVIRASGGELWIFENAPLTGLPTYLAPLGSISSIVINGTGGADSLTIDPGVTLAVTFDGGAGLDTVVANGGTVTFAATQDLASLAIGAAGRVNLATGGTTTVMTSALTISAGGRLDLADNRMIVRSSAANVASDRGVLWNFIRGGYNTGTWTGSGIASSVAAGDAQRRGVGLMVNNAGSGGARYATFGGVGGLTANDLLVRTTYYGDGDLDGDVDGADVSVWSLNYTGNQGSTSKIWSEGDWDYDGDVDGNDVGKWSVLFTGNLGLAP